MRLLVASALLFLFQFVSVNAFTVGYLLPAYICDTPAQDAAIGFPYKPAAVAGGAATPVLPKSLGGYLPYVQRLTAPTGSLTSTPRIDYATDAGTFQNTQLLLTNWHNRATITPCNHTIFTTTAVTTNAGTINNQIVPGQLHTITLTINGKFDVANGVIAQTCDFYANAGQVTADDIANIALDGAVVYAQNVNGTRIGNFTAFGPADATTMQSWYACGPTGSGIVHNQLISDVGQYTGIQWLAPANLVPGSTVTFKGAAVTDAGFGGHTSTFTIITPAAAGLHVATPAVTATVEFGPNLAVFFDSTAKNAPAANAAIVATSFTVTATFGAAKTTASATVNQSPALIQITPQMKGQKVTVSITASNGGSALPSTSAPFTYTVTPGVTVATAPTAEAILALCPGDVTSVRAAQGQDIDPDYQCAVQAQVIAALQTNTSIVIIPGNTATPTTSSAHRYMPTFSIIAIIAAAIALVYKH